FGKVASQQYVNVHSVGDWLAQVASGGRIAIVDLNLVSLAHLVRWVRRQFGDQTTIPREFDAWDSGETLFVLLMAAVVLIAFFSLRQRHGVDHERLVGRSWWAFLAFSTLGGLLVTELALLAPAINGAPVMGTRYLHFASYGVLIVL